MIKLSKQDMFADSQQTPMMKAPSTPSMTPIRSVKRRSEKKTSHITMSQLSTRTEAAGLAKSQPAAGQEDFDFYDLRTRQVPITPYSGNELWLPFGIEDSESFKAYQRRKAETPGTSEDEMAAKNLLEVKKESKSSNKCQLLFNFILIVTSAFLGAMCYAHFQHSFLSTDLCPPLRIAQDTEIDRSKSVDSNQQHQLASSVLHLSEEIKYMRDHLSKLLAHVGSEVNSSPQKGILEELLTADLASSGNLGSVLATPETTPVKVPVTVTLLWIFSFDMKMDHKPPHTTIGGLITDVGDCWAFEGSQGRLVLRLHQRSLVTGVSISHIPPSVTVSGDVNTAPRLFQVLAHDEDKDLQDGRLLGEFEYKTSGSWRQTFPLEPSEKTEVIIEFRFLKNHGNQNYTCVYRVHVHGKTPDI